LPDSNESQLILNSGTRDKYQLMINDFNSARRKQFGYSIHIDTRPRL